MKKPIFDFMDSRLFLIEVYRYRKESEKNFSYSQWSLELGMNNKTLLRLILQGKRKITPKSLEALADNLKMTEAEKEYFETLVDFTQAVTTSQRQSQGARLLTLQRKKFAQTSIVAESGILEDVYGPVVLMAVSSSEVPLSAARAAQLFGLHHERAESIFQFLMRAELIENKGAGYVAKHSTFAIKSQWNSKFLRQYYEYWLGQSISAIDLPAKLRKFRSIQIAMTEEEYESFLEKLNEFILTALSKAENHTLKNRRVYMMNNVLFPLTEIL